MADQVVYVLGKPNVTNQSNWDKMAWENAHPRDKRSNTSLVYFDYFTEKRRIWKSWAGEHPPRPAPDSEDAITSVLDLYDYIKGAKSRSVVELHFFCHEFEGGPVLYNTFENYPIDPESRDPDDKDPRIKDFKIPGILGGKDGSAFAQAFSARALVKLWGCNHREDFRQMIKTDYYRAKKPEDKQAIKERYQALIREGTYQFALHSAIGVPVFAGPLGWGTNPYLPFGIQGKEASKTKAKRHDRWPPKKGDEWWRVSQFFRPDGGREFYARELGASFDLLDYVAYEARIVRP